MKKIKEISSKIIQITTDISHDHVGAYAAQSAYFFMLCLIPIIPASSDTGALYTSDESRCYGGSDPGVPVICGDTDHIDRESGLQPVNEHHPDHGSCSALVSRKGCTCDVFRTELHLQMP